MDLRLYLRVIWRFRIIVAIGLALAVVLAVLSFVRISVSDGFKVSYRQSEDWQAATTYLVSGSGFAVGGVNSAGSSRSPVVLASLSAFYAQMAMSDDVRRLILESGPINGVVSAAPAVDNLTAIRAPLPLFTIFGDASTPGEALSLARRAGRAFKAYVARQQEVNGIAPSQRIVFPVVNAPKEAALVGPRKKTLPVVIFLTILTATIGLAFILENLRPRVRPISTLEEDDESRPTRRSA
jgi:hypothetical protein